MQEDSGLADDGIPAARRIGPDAAAGLAVYQNNYRAQLVGCLETSFPRVHRMDAATKRFSPRPSHILTVIRRTHGRSMPMPTALEKR
ncbi:HvfC/BufC family peptide modification chaperone [Cupriavidus basilensis]